MRKIIITFILVCFYSSSGICGAFNQQIEDFDNYISENKLLNWKSDVIDSKPPRNHVKRKIYPCKFLARKRTKGTAFYKVNNKDKNIPCIKKSKPRNKAEITRYKINNETPLITNVVDNITPPS